jgi:cytochrome c556
MRKVLLLIALCSLAAVMLVAQGRDLDPVMKEVGPLNGQLNGAVNGGSLADIATHAAKMEALMKEAEVFMKTKGATQGQSIAAEAAAAAGEMAKAAKAGNLDGAKAAVGKVKGSCKACHTIHRDQLPDKSYVFKKGN